jgi:hypothetical protein
MEVVERIVAWITGLQLLAPHHLDLPTLVVTGLAVNVCNAIMCRLIARNNGYPPRLWTILGFVFSIWAVAILLLAPKRGPARS